MKLPKAIILAGLIPSIHGSVLFTDDFESPVVSGGYQTFSMGQSFHGWTVTSGNVDLVGAGYWASKGQVVDLNGTGPGTIQRTLSTTLGQKYEIAFDVRSFAADSRMSLDWSGSTFTFQDSSTSNFHTTQDHHVSRIVLGNGTDTLSFASLNGSGSGFALDFVTINPVDMSTPLSTTGTTIDFDAVVPEPQEWAMIAGAGLCAFAGWRRGKVLCAS